MFISDPKTYSASATFMKRKNLEKLGIYCGSKGVRVYSLFYSQ